MMHGYIPARHADLAYRIALEKLGPPRFSGRMLDWQNGALVLCPEGDGKTFVYIKAAREGHQAFDAIAVACALLADQAT